MEIINLPMDEFNERLSKYDLSETQLSLIRDIRRRGKNKVAAQNCRKRKLDQILSLADEVEEVRKRKERLLKEQDSALAERKRIMKKFQDLYKHIFEVSFYSINIYTHRDVFLCPNLILVFFIEFYRIFVIHKEISTHKLSTIYNNRLMVVYIYCDVMRTVIQIR